MSRVVLAIAKAKRKNNVNESDLRDFVGNRSIMERMTRYRHVSVNNLNEKL